MIDDERRISILRMAHGAIEERVDYEMTKIIDNIMDVNTAPDAKRKLTLTLTLKPDGDRRVIAVDVAAKSTLVPTRSVVTSLWIDGDPARGVTAVEMVPQIPGQVNFDGGTQEEVKILRLVNAN